MKQGKRRWLKTPFSIEHRTGCASMKSNKRNGNKSFFVEKKRLNVP